MSVSLPSSVSGASQIQVKSVTATPTWLVFFVAVAERRDWKENHCAFTFLVVADK
jgi:hypothetical protein